MVVSLSLDDWLLRKKAQTLGFSLGIVLKVLVKFNVQKWNRENSHGRNIEINVIIFLD